MRLDKYLKVSRLIKRRTVANEACDNERVMVNGRVQRWRWRCSPWRTMWVRPRPPPCTGRSWTARHNRRVPFIHIS